jgi:hypothetical protein
MILNSQNIRREITYNNNRCEQLRIKISGAINGIFTSNPYES